MPTFVWRKAILALLVYLGPCILMSLANAADLSSVRVGLIRDARSAPLLIAMSAGYFTAQGLDVSLSYLPSDAAVSHAVGSHQVDIGFETLSANFYQYAAAHDLKIIASRSSERTGFPVSVLLISQRAKAGFSGARGLLEKRIGVLGTDSVAFYGLMSILSRFHLDADSVHVVTLKSHSEELQALSRHRVDAALLPLRVAVPYTTEGRALFRLSDYSQWQEGVVFATADAINAKRDLLQRFIQAYQHGTSDYQLNFLNYDDGGDFIPGPEYTRYLDFIAQQDHVTPQALAATKTYCDRRANLDAADMEHQVLFWKERGQLSDAIKPADLWDLTFIGEERGGASLDVQPQRPLQRLARH
jgi:ABC-type nitrate/sulfonate/bicarbonate transport system substrate-binding protein